MKKSTKSKNSFTLLELIVCIAILGLIASVVGWQLKGMLETQRLQANVHRLLIRLRELQTIALTRGTDIQLILKQEKEGLSYRVETDEPLPFLNAAPPVLLSGCTATFNETPQKLVTLHISPAGRIEPLGILEIKKEHFSRKIDLSRPLMVKIMM